MSIALGKKTYITLVLVHDSHYREDGVIQGTWAEGSGAQLSTGLHRPGAEGDQQDRL